jgi:glutathione reductase (NADPH)
MRVAVSTYQYDLLVIGAGSGGVRAARFAAQYGARVAIAEDLYLGGTCVNVGCVPKKLMVYASHFEELFRDSVGYGWTPGEPAFDWGRLIANKDREITRLNEIYGRLLEQAGATIYRAHARLLDEHTAQVGDETITAANILLATGCWPWVPDFPGRELAITSNELFHLEKMPRRLVIVGGGYVAVEFAGVFNGLGVETEIVYRGDLFLRGFDTEVRNHLAAEMRKKGVKISFKQEVERITREQDGSLRVWLADGNHIDCDCVLYATGRRARIENLGLDAAGVELDSAGYIRADEHFRTSVPNIYAIGDVIGGMELTPLALAQGMAVAKTMFRGEATTVDAEYIPTAVFSQPSLATVGYSEELARERFGEISVFVAQFTQLKHTMAANAERTLMKLVVEKASDRVVGAHMVGPDAGEIMQGIAVAVRAGATKAIFDTTLGIHPTAAEEFVTMRTVTR